MGTGESTIPVASPNVLAKPDLAREVFEKPSVPAVAKEGNFLKKNWGWIAVGIGVTTSIMYFYQQQQNKKRLTTTPVQNAQ